MLTLKKEVVNRGVVVYQKVHETAQGGFTLDTTGLVLGAILLAGTVIGYDESTRKASVLKAATLQANASNTDTGYRVLKGHPFKVGDVVTSGLFKKAFTIQSIDTATSTDYDLVTLNTTLGVVLTAGKALFGAAVEASGNTSAFSVTPKGTLYEDTRVQVGADLAVVLRGTLYARRAPGAADDVKAALPLIIFSQSF